MTEQKTVKLSEIIGAGYDAFWADRSRYRVVKGGKASKKSSTIALGYIYNMMRCPKSNLLVIRRVADTNRSSTYQQLIWAIHRLGVDGLWKCTLSPLEIEYRPTGQKILFRGMDNAQKLASITVSNGYLCWVWIEEAFEIESEDEFDKLDLSAPRGQVPEPLWKQTTISFNPWSEHHWLKARFFDPPDDDLKHSYTTNYMCNEWLDERDRAIYEKMKLENPRKYDVAGLGNWGIAEGLIFERWRVGTPEEYYVHPTDKLTCQPKTEWKEPWKWSFHIGLDFGYTNDPSALICIWVNPVDRIIYIASEFYKTRMLNIDIAEEVKRMGHAKDLIIADCAEEKSIAELNRNGIRVKPCMKGKGSVLDGIDRIQSYTIIVDPDCKSTIAELSSYCWEKNKDGSGKNVPVDKNNHLMDALRYAMQGVIGAKPQSKPKAAAGFELTGGWDG